MARHAPELVAGMDRNTHLGLSSHPSLWIARQRQPSARHRHRSRASASAGASTCRCARRGQRRSRMLQTHFRVPTLRRPDARDRDLRARSTHPWAAGFIARTMIDVASINKTSTAAFGKIMPLRTPVASCRKTLHHRRDNRLLNSPRRCVLGWPPTRIDQAASTIFASLASTNIQIPIDPQLC